MKKATVIITTIILIISVALVSLSVRQKKVVNQNEEAIPNEPENSFISEQEEPKYSDETFIIQYKEGIDDETRIALNELYGVEEVDAIGEDGENIKVLKVKEGYTVEGVLEKYMADPNIEYAEPDYLCEFYYVPNDPYYKNMTSIFNMFGLQQAWDTTKGENVVVAVVDSGVIGNHPDLASNLLPGYSAVSSLSPNTDSSGHGTCVAGIIGGIGNNGIGGIGVSFKSKVIPVKVDDANGTMGIANVAKGIRWAADNGAQVINLSIGSYSDSTTLRNEINYAYNKGCVLVAASGNEGKNNHVSFPARYSNVIGVGASNDGTTRAAFSDYGPELDVVAMNGYWTTTSSGGYQAFAATSCATPQVAGLAALLLAVDPTLTPDQVKNYIQNGAKGNGTRINDEVGYGFINMRKVNTIIISRYRRRG